jgi:tetratricopeptide (TPR) repeat protein
MLAQAYFDANNIAAGAAEMDKAIATERAAGKKPDENWYNVVFVRFYNAHDRANSALWATRWLKDYPTAENWRRLIVNYRNSQNNGVQLSKGQKLDMFRLMRATHALADENDYLDYANSAQQTGLPWEAVTVIGEAKAANKIAAGAPQFNVILTASQTQVKSEGSLDALIKPSQAAANGKMAAESGDAFLASDNYAQAVELYDVALQKGSVDTDAVNLHRGVALFKLGRKDEARTAFGQVKTAPFSDIAGFWVTWMDLPTPPGG